MTGPPAPGPESWQKIVETAFQGIWSLDDIFVTTFVNSRMADLLGYEPREMVGRPFEEFVFPEELADHARQMNERRSGRNGNYERRLRRKDGRFLWASISATSQHDAEGRFAGSFALIDDITSRKETESALAESEARYRAIFENAVEGIFQTTPDGRFLDVNPAGAGMEGFDSPEEFMTAVNEGRFQLWVDLETRRRYFSLLETEGAVSGLEVESRRRDGISIWLSINATAIRDADGRTIRYEGTTVDVTEIRRARQALAEQARFLQTLVDAMPHPVYFKDRGGKYLGCNRAFEAAMELTNDQVVGRTVFDVFPAASATRAHELDEELLASPGVQFYESVLETPTGERGAVLFQKATFEGANGAVAGIIGSIVDLTDLKRAEAAVRQLNDELEVRVRERTHELTDGLHAEGDPDLLRIVLRNLLENALKFTAARKTPRIEVGSTAGAPPGELGPAQSVFFVRDNGAGFDMRYADKLFGPFQRLHAEAEFPGSGIGLATTSSAPVATRAATFPAFRSSFCST
jgi:PAS domain S-box-containing protein